MTAIKADTLTHPHTHTHIYRETHSHAHTTLTWRGVAILSHEHTLLIRNVGHRLRSKLPLASLAALIKLVLDCYYGCIAWHRLMCVTRRTQQPVPPTLAPPRAAFPPVRQLFLCRCRIVFLCCCFFCCSRIEGGLLRVFESVPHKKGLRRAR